MVVAVWRAWLALCTLLVCQTQRASAMTSYARGCMTESKRVVRDLNAEQPAWATHGVVVLLNSTGGNSPEGECESALVVWCASAAEMERAWGALCAMADEITSTPAVKKLDALESTRYVLCVSGPLEIASIDWEPLSAVVGGAA